MESFAIYQSIGKFLADHGLYPTPDNYALAYALFADEGSAAAKAVRSATSDGIRLSQREADRIKSEVGLPVTAPPPQPGGLDPAVLAAAHQRVEEFAALVEAQRVDAQSYRTDLQAGADRLEAGEDGSIAALVAITRAMADRTKKVEEQLTDDERFSLVISLLGHIPGSSVGGRDARIPEDLTNMSAGYTPGVPRLGIPAIQSSAIEAPSCSTRRPSATSATSRAITNSRPTMPLSRSGGPGCARAPSRAAPMPA